MPDIMPSRIHTGKLLASTKIVARPVHAGYEQDLPPTEDCT